VGSGFPLQVVVKVLKELGGVFAEDMGDPLYGTGDGGEEVFQRATDDCHPQN
jgi:hypothetical protein